MRPNQVSKAAKGCGFKRLRKELKSTLRCLKVIERDVDCSIECCIPSLLGLVDSIKRYRIASKVPADTTVAEHFKNG